MPEEPNPRIIALREQYSAREVFLDKYNPAHGVAVTDERECALGDSPTIVMMDMAWGEGTAIMFLAAQLYALNEHTNATVKLTARQARECAALIVGDNDYKALKADELVLFFARLKLGHYGHFYNSVDTIHITAALKQFIGDMAVKKRVWFEQEESKARDAAWREHQKVYLRPAEFRAWKARYQARQNGTDQQ